MPDQRITMMVMGMLQGLCKGLTLIKYRSQPPSEGQDGFVVYACCVKQPALEQNMRIVLATALWPISTTNYQLPFTITFGDQLLVWLDLQFQNVMSTEPDWQSLQTLLCGPHDDDMNPETKKMMRVIRTENLKWTIPKEVEMLPPNGGDPTVVFLDAVPIQRTASEVLPGYITFDCRETEGGESMAQVLVLNRYISKSTPLMLRGTTGLKAEGTLYLALQEWCTRIVPPM